jgi:hypothetical protein
MSILMQRAVNAIEALPAAEQDAIASIVLAELDDDIAWTASFARSLPKLQALADRAKSQVDAGECRMAGFDHS